MRRHQAIILGALLALSGCDNPAPISLLDASSGTDAGSGSDAGFGDSGQNAIDAEPAADGHIHTDVDADTNADAETNTDADAVPADPCASDSNPESTVGCNGFVAAEPAPNEPGGTCTQGDELNPQGSCMSTTAVCAGPEGETQGTCLYACTPTPTYVSTSDCAMGFRCFTFSLGEEGEEGLGICFRDCDDAHACPTGQICDEEGSCIDEEGGDEGDI